jgi:hypothetical protein
MNLSPYPFVNKRGLVEPLKYLLRFVANHLPRKLCFIASTAILQQLTRKNVILKVQSTLSVISPIIRLYLFFNSTKHAVAINPDLVL